MPPTDGGNKINRSNRVAAQIAQELGATACTDVTGFGVLGHLVEMCKAAKSSIPCLDIAGAMKMAVSVTLFLGSIPVLSGATECVEAGIYSSLHPSNLRLRHAIQQKAGKGQVAMHTLERQRHRYVYSLLFDPQTSGGLIVALPASTDSSSNEYGSAENYVRKLHANGYPGAAIIGKVAEPIPEEAAESPVCIRLAEGR